MINISQLLPQIHIEIIRILTGQLFTKEQISQISQHAVGKYLTEFFPEPEREEKAKERVEEALQHIVKANAIISAMQVDLDAQNSQLNLLLQDIEDKKKLAERYALLAQTNEAQFSAYKEEMSRVLKNELIQQSERGKTLRRISSALIWLLTLLIGAALGTYFKEIIAWTKAIFLS